MYAGFVTTKHSWDWLGAHQQFNKAAHRMLPAEVDGGFPRIGRILHFEGYNGPDGLKLKSTGHREPDHFYDPQTGQGSVLAHIENHYQGLVESLASGEDVRAAFEASWLAHAVVDGLTPAHHYDSPHQLKDLRNHRPVAGNGHSTHKKLIANGHTTTDSLRRTMRLVGLDGLLTKHVHFEMGVAAAILTANYYKNVSPVLLQRAQNMGPVEFFQEQAHEINQLELYHRFCREGWTVDLARRVKYSLAPTIAHTIGVIWLLSHQEAGPS